MLRVAIKLFPMEKNDLTLLAIILQGTFLEINI